MGLIERTSGGLRPIAAAAALAALTAAGPAPADDTITYRVRSTCARLARCFTSIQSALDAAAGDRSPGWVAVHIGPGAYYEKIILRRPRLRLIGTGTRRTRLYFDAVAEHAAQYDRNGWGTAGSATLTIAAQDVTIRDLTIENSFDYLANDSLPRDDARRMGNAQGLAVLLDVDSDRVSFDRVALLGHQDTLFAHGRRALFRNGTIAGNIDFIFGDGMLLIEDSVIRSRPRAAPVAPGDFASYITAPSTPITQPVGIVIHRSRLTRDPGVADGSVALGRPWHPTTTFADGRYADPAAVGQAIFIDCFMDAHIHPDHWTGMAGTARDGTKTHIFPARDARFAATGSTGPGAARWPVAIAWNRPPGIAAVRAIMFAGWIIPPR